MAGRKKDAKRRAGTGKSGPYLAAAVFCEMTIEDKSDGAVSAIRIVDQITVFVPADAPDNLPSEENRIPVKITALVSFRSGKAPGKYILRQILESPSGKKSPPQDREIVLSDKPSGGANARINNVINVSNGGLFWIHVFLGDRLFTRMPLEIVVQRQQPQGIDVGETK
jgi:hypothetical protein